MSLMPREKKQKCHMISKKFVKLPYVPKEKTRWLNKTHTCAGRRPQQEYTK